MGESRSRGVRLRRRLPKRIEGGGRRGQKVKGWMCYVFVFVAKGFVYNRLFRKMLGGRL